MIAAFSVNLHVSAGHDFSQEFYLSNPDRSFMNITGCKFSGHIQKNPGSIIARETELAGVTGSPVNNYVYNCIPLDIIVSNGVKGIYQISIPGESTLHVDQGKYVYSVTMTDVNGVKTQTLNGLVFIDFGAIA
jgi:hypothetical protein